MPSLFFDPRALVRPWCFSPAPSSHRPPVTAGQPLRPPWEHRDAHGHLATRWWCPQRASLETQIKPVYFHIGDQNILCRLMHSTATWVWSRMCCYLCDKYYLKMKTWEHCFTLRSPDPPTCRDLGQSMCFVFSRSLSTWHMKKMGKKNFLWGNFC